MSGYSRRAVLAADGMSLNVEDSRNGEGVYLLLHGFGEGGYVWENFAPRLAAHKRVVIADLRGHGKSDWAASGNYGLDRYVEDIVRVTDELGLRQVTVVGHSLGGLVALKIAELRSAAVDRLVIVDFSPDTDADAELVMRSFLKESLKTYPALDDYVAWIKSYRPLLSEEMAKRVALGALRPAPDGGFVMRFDPAILDGEPLRQESDNDIWQVLRGLSVPTLIMRGEWSGVLLRPTAERMRECLARGRTVTIRKAGHGVMLDNPDQFLSELIDFSTALEACK